MRHKIIQFILLFVGLLIFNCTQAQTHLTIGVYMKPGTYEEIEPAQITKLETRIISVISTSGSTYNISASRMEPDTAKMDDPELMETMARGVVCYPKFEIYDEKMVDLGLKKMTVVDASLTMTVQYIHEDIIFSSMAISLQGSGKDKKQAINDIIRNIRPQDPKWRSFVQNTREKIIGYYDTHCEAIIAKAEQLDKMDSPWDAVQILWPIPQEVECYERVKDQTVEIYLRAINQRCRQYLLRAKTEIAKNNFDTGLSYLGSIDPKSDCYEEVLQLIDKVALEVDKTSVEERANNLALEKIRLQVEKERNSSDRMTESVAKRNASTLRTTIISSGNK